MRLGIRKYERKVALDDDRGEEGNRADDGKWWAGRGKERKRSMGETVGGAADKRPENLRNDGNDEDGKRNDLERGRWRRRERQERVTSQSERHILFCR